MERTNTDETHPSFSSSPRPQLDEIGDPLSAVSPAVAATSNNTASPPLSRYKKRPGVVAATSSAPPPVLVVDPRLSRTASHSSSTMGVPAARSVWPPASIAASTARSSPYSNVSFNQIAHPVASTSTAPTMAASASVAMMPPRNHDSGAHVPRVSAQAQAFIVDNHAQLSRLYAHKRFMGVPAQC